MVSTLVLAQLLSHCAPRIGPRTMASIIRVESGGAVFAIHDNDTGQSFSPSTFGAAVDVATRLIASNHSVDLGLAQINSANLRALSVPVTDAFDPCTNIRVGAVILSDAYLRARQRFGPGQLALRRALGAYNTGSLKRGDRYIAAVISAAQPGWTGSSATRAPNVRRPALASHRPATSRGRLAVLARAIGPQDAPILVPMLAVSTGLAP